MKNLNFITYENIIDSKLCVSGVLYELSIQFQSDNFLYFETSGQWTYSHSEKAPQNIIFFPYTIPENIDEIIIKKIIETKSRIIFFDNFLSSIRDICKSISIINFCVKNNCMAFFIMNSDKLNKIPFDLYDNYKVTHKYVANNKETKVFIDVPIFNETKSLNMETFIKKPHDEWILDFYKSFIDNKINQIFL